MSFVPKIASRAIMLLCSTVLCSGLSLADAGSRGEDKASAHAGHAANNSYATSHAPIGVMGDHRHKAGEVMLSYRLMQMSMKGNRSGSSSLSAEKIATTVSNRFFGQPMQPPTLRVVPTDMSMQMHMLGLMYAPNDSVTLMAMANYQEKSMDHITFMGPTGTTQLGTFTTRTRGVGDTSLSALIKLNDAAHAMIGVSIPTGDIEKSDRILTPMGASPSPRLPYPMQLGSGSYDIIAGATYARTKSLSHSQSTWGAQWRSVLRTGNNDEHYALGDEHQLSSWLSYTVMPSVELSARLVYFKRENIHNIDAKIVAPVQTADPSRQAAERWDIAFGGMWASPGHRHRLALEIAAPFAQHLDGPQLKQDYQLTLGWQFSP